MWALLLAVYAAAAAEPRFGVSAGLEAVVNDPFVYRRGLRYGLAFAPAEGFEVGIAGGWYPSLGSGGCADPDWTAKSCALLEEASIAPHISKLIWQGQATVRLLPLRVDMGRWRTAVGLLAGFGFVATHDDLVTFQNDEADALATERQLHPTTVAGWLGEVREEHLGVRLRMEYLTYIEVLEGTELEMKRNLFAGGEVMWWF
jgi:hypothetical protein